MSTSTETVIFYDVDGTLAEPFQSPSHSIKKVLSSLDQSGIRQILCSGKGKDYLAGMARGLGIESTSDVIAENGGIIYDWRKQRIDNIAEEESIKVKKIRPKILEHVKKYNYSEELKETIITLFMDDVSLAPMVANSIKQMLNSEDIDVEHYSDGAIDVVSGNIHKGLAVGHYIKKYSPSAKVYTCGDGMNDLEMLSIGYPITFNNAHPEVKKAVKKNGGIVTDEDGPKGLLQAISRLVYDDHITDTINNISYILRSWGSWEVLTKGKDFKVKKMTVTPGSSLSLQKHHHRSEHWFVFEGEAEINVNNKIIILSEGEDYFIPEGGIHQVSNPGNSELVIIEVQRGKYLGEDDIVRY